MELTVEPAGIPDVEAMSRLLQQLFAIEADFHFDSARVRRALEQLLEQEQACLLVARCEGRVVGMCSAQLVISTAEGAYSAWVEDVVVDRDHRGRGIGRQLLDGIAAWARGRGATRLQLLADRENEQALEFYRNHGWHQTQLLAWRSLPGQ